MAAEIETEAGLARSARVAGVPWLIALLAVAVPAQSQEGMRPSDLRIEAGPLPEPEESPERPALELAPAPQVPESGRLSTGAEAYVARIVVEGSSVFAPEDLAAALSPFEGRMTSTRDLYRARDAVSRLYHDAGYLTSGAVLPDQEVRGGVVVLRVVEGELGEIRVSGTRHFRPAYFESRLRLAGRAPVNVWRIEEALQRFQGLPLVSRISARLEPTGARGRSRLEVEVEEALPARLDLSASNYRSPSLGEYSGEVAGSLANLIGVGDEIAAVFEGAEGLRDVEASYSLPLNRYDTTASFHFRDSRGEVVLEEFEALDIESESRSWGLGLEQPVLRGASGVLTLGLLGELRESRTEIAGSDFCSTGATDCSPRISVLRTYQQYLRSGQSSALALRSTFSVGLDAFGATRNPGGAADGRFFAWLGQLQWVYRLPRSLWDSVLIGRVDTQLAADPLLSLEKVSVGGARTVRGYRENTLIRDSGVVASLELRVPLIRLPGERFRLELAPFVDTGHAWDEGGPADLGSDTLASLGVGLRASLFQAVRGEIYWGGRLTDAPGDDEPGLQRHGVHFRVTVDSLAPWR